MLCIRTTGVSGEYKYIYIYCSTFFPFPVVTLFGQSLPGGARRPIAKRNEEIISLFLGLDKATPWCERKREKK